MNIMGLFDIFQKVGAGNEPLSEEKQNEIRKYYSDRYQEEYDKERDRVLNEVRVMPGQDPYMAATAALINGEEGIVLRAQKAAQKMTTVTFKISGKQLQATINKE